VSAPTAVGVDVGTQFVKAALFALDGSAQAQATVPLALQRDEEGGVTQGPEDFYRATAAGIASCVEQAPEQAARVVGVGVAGQMAGIIGTGADGRAVTPYDSWLDSRCEPEMAAAAARLGPRWAEVTGCPPMVAHAAKMLWWQSAQPRAYERVARFLVANAFVAGRLCGLGAEDAYVDYTHLHFTGAADAARGQWSPELVSRLGLDPGRLPRIVAPTDRVGGLSAEAARDCRLRPGTCVCAGLGDTAAGALGAGVVRPGQAFDSSGTASVLGLSVDGYRPDPTGMLVNMRGAVPGQWVVLSYLAGGDVLRWLPSVVGDAPLEVLLKEAESAPPGTGLYFVPYLGGRVLPASPTARGAWAGIGFNHSRADLVRSVLESVAYEYAGYLEHALALSPGVRPREVRALGGGSHSTFWNTLKASALGLPYMRVRQASPSCWGAALTAAVAAGALPDLAAAASVAPSAAASSVAPSAAAAPGSGDPGADQVGPDPELQRIYGEGRPRYRRYADAVLAAGAEP
jgi:xylulokinase